MWFLFRSSKRVKTALSDSIEFSTACDSVYRDYYASAVQNVDPALRRFPLSFAGMLLHVYVTLSHLPSPLIVKWVPSSPSESQVNSALRVTISRRRHQFHDDSTEEEEILGREEFKGWAVEAFAESVVACARKALLGWILGGVAGIVGIGAVTLFARDVGVAPIGVYALGIVTWALLSLWLNT